MRRQFFKDSYQALKRDAEQAEEKFMKTTVGLWIDHRKAVVVFVTAKEEEIMLINSDFEKPYRQSGASVRADDLRQRELTEHLNNYYDEVISSLRNAEAILIMGPGEAKGELKNRIERNGLNGREIEVETVDKMTDRQIVAKVRDRLLKQSRAS
jgi:stalled ribosome rescue protein Dom34